MLDRKKKFSSVHGMRGCSFYQDGKHFNSQGELVDLDALGKNPAPEAPETPNNADPVPAAETDEKKEPEPTPAPTSDPAPAPKAAKRKAPKKPKAAPKVGK